MKGLIVAAGYGTRMLPLTKVIPKEILPLADRPALDPVVHEFLEAGIKDLIIITSRRKKALEDYFDVDFELETILHAKKDHEKIERLNATNFDLNVTFIRQPRMKGSAHAISLASPFIGNEPVAVAYPDDIFIGTPGPISELITVYKKTHKNVISLYEVPREEVYRYGVATIATNEDEHQAVTKQAFYTVIDMVEKPKVEEAPSNLIVPGRYVFTPEFFKKADEILASEKTSEVKEITQTEVLKELIKDKKVVGTVVSSTRIDTGKKLGYFVAFTLLAAQHGDLGEEYQEFLKNLVKNDFQLSKEYLSTL